MPRFPLRCRVCRWLFLFLCVPVGATTLQPMVLLPSHGSRPHPTQRGLPTKTRLWRTRGATWSLHLEMDGAGVSCLAASLTNENAHGSWIGTVNTHLHRDLRWCLAASSSQVIYQSWHHNHPQLLCQTVHPWKEKQIALMHPAYNWAGGEAAASPSHQESSKIQCSAGFKAKA